MDAHLLGAFLEMNVFLRVLPYVRRYPALAFGTLACAVVGTLMVIVFPTVTQYIIDEVIRKNQPQMLLPLVAIGLASFVAQDGLNGIRIIFNNSFEQRVIFDLRSELYAHIQLLPLKWFDNRATGDIMTRLIEDVTSVERVLIDGIEQGSVSILQIIIVSGVMLAYSWELTLVALLPIPLLAAALSPTLSQRGDVTASIARRPPLSMPCCMTTSRASARSRPTPASSASTRVLTPPAKPCVRPPSS